MVVYVHPVCSPLPSVRGMDLGSQKNRGRDGNDKDDDLAKGPGPISRWLILEDCYKIENSTIWKGRLREFNAWKLYSRVQMGYSLWNEMTFSAARNGVEKSREYNLNPGRKLPKVIDKSIRRWHINIATKVVPTKTTLLICNLDNMKCYKAMTISTLWNKSNYRINYPTTVIITQEIS